MQNKSIKNLNYITNPGKIYNKADEIKELCKYANDILTENKKDSTVAGWTVEDKLAKTRRMESNFKAVTYKKGGEYVICFIGTDTKSLKDLYADVRMGLPVVYAVNKQMKEAEEYLDTIKKRHPNAKITLAGHSEGGSEAQYVRALKGNENIETYTFNAYGIKPIINKIPANLKSDGNYENVYNFIHPDDPVSKLGENIGNEYYVKGIRRINCLTNFGSMKAHTLNNFGNCADAKPKEEYVKLHKSHPSAVDKILLRDEDFKGIDSDTFAFLEPFINNALSTGKIYSSSEAFNLCHRREVIWVDSYTKEDGTKVKGYYRRISGEIV